MHNKDTFEFNATDNWNYNSDFSSQSNDFVTTARIIFNRENALKDHLERLKRSFNDVGVDIEIQPAVRIDPKEQYKKAEKLFLDKFLDKHPEAKAYCRHSKEQEERVKNKIRNLFKQQYIKKRGGIK